MIRELAIKVIEIDAQIALLLTMPDMYEKVELLKKQKLEIYRHPHKFYTKLKTN